MAHCHIANLLEKMISPDKDFRFMATNDLISELQKPSIKLDDEIEKKIVKMLLFLLEDKNGEVQNLAVKCLGPLVNKVKHVQVELIVETLCKNMVCDNDQLRDISSIGLKTVIIELPKSSSESISSVCNKITDKLTNVIQKNLDVPVQLEALDILSDLLNRFGNQLENYYTSIQEALLPLLQSQRLAVRKRSITALSYLCTTCETELFDKTINFLLTQLSENSSDINLISTYIQCIAAISRLSGHKLGDHLEKIIPVVINLSSYNDDELKEYCIQAFDAFVRKAPKEITQYVPLITDISLKYLCHDPNYNYDENEDEEMELDNDFESESNDEYSDDDDMSWKVRRASAKCLEAIISTRHEMLIEIHKTISPILIARYKEREENVKVDIFNAYISLLKQTKNYVANFNDTDSPILLLEKQVPNIIKTIHKQLKEKSVKTRQGSFNLLIELITVLPGCLKDHLEILIPGILYSLNDKNTTSNMKIDTLVFFNTLLKTHSSEVFQPHLNLLLPAIISSVDDSFYKISSEALVVLIQIIKMVRPEYGETNFSSCIEPIYKCTYLKLKASDLDQEVKERAIACMGQLIHTFGDVMQNDLNVALTLLVERLKNEITRLTTIKAFTLIASSPFKINFAPYLGDALPILAGFLRKNQRNLKINSLILLDTLVKNYGNQIQPNVIEIILNELPQLVNESDLYISQLTLNLLTTLIKLEKGYFEVITGKVLEETLFLIRSPLLQGTALQSILDFFQALVYKPYPNFSFDQLLSSLKEPVYNTDPETSVNLHKQAYHSIAKCVSAISTLDQKKAFNTVSNLMMDIINYKSFDNIQSFALLAIGEIGKNVDLSSFTDLKELLLSALNSTSEEVKSAASFALGSISVGNLQEYLPFVLQKIEARDKRQYLILHSLKEIISCQSINPVMIQTLKPHLDSIWSLLLNHCQCPEEGTRNVVAECLGKLITMNPEELLPKLQSYLTHNNPLARSTVVTAMKFTISEQPQSVDVLLKQCIGEFLKSLEDEDLNVRRVALVAFNSAAHNKPSLVRDLLNQILPLLYKETKVKKELIREVEMGPFKHSVDDGLDIRKAAFECMYTLLDSCLDKIDIFEFLNHVESGLKDHYDIRMLTFLMLIRLTVLRPTAVLNRIDKLVESLKDICTEKYKSNAVKQENEKLEELKRSAMRAFLALLTIPDADKNITASTFYSSIKNNEELQKLYDQIQSDNINLSGDSNAAMEIN